MFYRRTAVGRFNNQTKLPVGLCKNLNRLRLEGKYCDLHLVVNGYTMPAHRAVLAASSSYFDTMLSGSFVEGQSRTVELSDAFRTSETLLDILSYLYTGQIILTEDNYHDILNAATHFLLEDLRDSCSHFIFVNLSPVNALQQWVLADMFNLNHLADVAALMVRARFHDLLIFREEPLHVPSQALKRVITEGAMDFLYSMERVKFLLNWAAVNLEERTAAVDALLQDEEICAKLGIPPWRSPGGPRREQEEDAQEEVVGLSTGMDYLRSLLDDPQISAPQLTETNEALMGWHYKPQSDPDTRVLTVCAYVVNTNRWYTITKIKVSRHFGNLMGFIGRKALFQSLYGFCVVNLDDLTFERIALPSLQRTSGVRSHNVFLFDNRVFCLMEISRYVRGGGLPNDAPAFLYPEAQSFLKVYNFETRQWSKVCDIPVPTQMTWLPLQFHIIPRHNMSRCYILAMSSSNVLQARAAAESWRINGPYMLVLYKRRTKYALNRLADPPVDQVEKGDTYRSLRFTGKNDKLYFYGVPSHSGHQRQMCQGLMQYKPSSNEWTILPSLPITFPKAPLIQVEGLETSTAMVGSAANGGVESFQHGHLYHLRVQCPFVCQFWAADIESGDVRELAPPPCEILHEFAVCELPFAVLDGACAHYSKRFERGGQSPLVHGNLAGYDKWACSFSQATSCPASPGISVSHSSSSSSESEVDVQN